MVALPAAVRRIAPRTTFVQHPRRTSSTVPSLKRLSGNVLPATRLDDAARKMDCGMSRWRKIPNDQFVTGADDRMLRRYLGKIPIAQLKRYPTTLESVFGKAI